MPAGEVMTSDRPLVSVVIPAYNACAFIDDAIASVLTQDYPNIEVIVVDDGSIDDTAARAVVHGPRVQCLHRQNSGGYPGAVRNTGIAHAQGRYLAFLDADDIMLAGRLSSQVTFLERHPGVGLVFSDYRNVEAAGPAASSHFEACISIARAFAGRSSIVLDSPAATAHLAHENFGIPSTTMLRREVLATVPAFPTMLQTSEDFVFFYLVARRFPIGAMAKIGALRRLHSGNTTADTLRVLRNHVARRAMLRNTETIRHPVRLLTRFIGDAERHLADLYADQRRFRDAIACGLRSLRHSGGDVTRGQQSLRTLARTVALAAGVKPR